MEKPTKSAPVVTKTAPNQAPGEPLDSPPDKSISFSQWRPLSGAAPLHVQLAENDALRAELQRIERLEAALFPGRRPKP